MTRHTSRSTLPNQPPLEFDLRVSALVFTDVHNKQNELAATAARHNLGNITATKNGFSGVKVAVTPK
jgi:hypothetical protein